MNSSFLMAAATASVTAFSKAARSSACCSGVGAGSILAGSLVHHIRLNHDVDIVFTKDVGKLEMLLRKDDIRKGLGKCDGRKQERERGEENFAVYIACAYNITFMPYALSWWPSG